MPSLMKTAREVSARRRAARFQRIEERILALPKPIKIIDIGGTNEFWESAGWTTRPEVHVTLVNLFPQEQKHDNVLPVQGDATALDYRDDEFSLAFSNSVIEHLFTYENQQKMAAEVDRVARAYYVQTPNFWFPVEPHFHFLGWHWLPESIRIEILRRRTCGFRPKTPDLDRARESVREIRLLTRSELKRLFPGAEIEAEKMFGLVKSWMVLKGL